MSRSAAKGYAAVLALSCLCAAHATPVTVSVKSSSDASAADTLVIFDPLDRTPPAGHATAVVDQVHKHFVPRTSVIRTGTAVTFPNSDNIRHQVYSLSEAKKFTLKLYAGSPKVEVLFDKPGLVVLGCNIHDTMVAFVGVVDTPYFGKVTDSGALTLDLPEGRYKVRIWNDELGVAAPSPEITVGHAPLALPILVTIDPSRESPADWPE